MNLDHSQSSNLHSSLYDDQTKELRMTFKDTGGGPGKTYLYRGVPRETVDGFANAESHGKYFHAQIRSKFKGEPVSE